MEESKMFRILNYILSILVRLKKKKGKIHSSNIIQWSTAIDNNSTLGRYCYIGKNVSITKTDIGSYTSIANNVSIGQGEHKIDEISTSSIFYKNEYEQLTAEDCKIGSDVWIGAGVVVLRGVTIGNGAIIGANAVVTKDIPEFSIAVGVPARVIRKRISEDVIKQIKMTEWWDFDLDKPKEIIANINRESDEK
ncbi:CatB-related O-acetyltransferase [Acinetobacter ursingii]|uniref:CatB-related O-acetyltransferase n=1 Tax=Acinetobacter ursingii TaxID=108980 RepID=UPI003009A882